MYAEVIAGAHSLKDPFVNCVRLLAPHTVNCILYMSVMDSAMSTRRDVRSNFVNKTRNSNSIPMSIQITVDHVLPSRAKYINLPSPAFVYD